MRKLLKLLPFAAAIGAAAYASISAANTFQGTATASVVDRIELVGTPAQLDFGSFSVGPLGGTIDHTSMDATKTGDIEIITQSNRANFSLRGRATTSATVTGDDSVTLTSGSDTMNAALAFPATIMFSGTGETSLRIGGLLTVAGNQPAGNYAGTYNFTINY